MSDVVHRLDAGVVGIKGRCGAEATHRQTIKPDEVTCPLCRQVDDPGVPMDPETERAILADVLARALQNGNGDVVFTDMGRRWWLQVDRMSISRIERDVLRRVVTRGAQK